MGMGIAYIACVKPSSHVAIYAKIMRSQALTGDRIGSKLVHVKLRLFDFSI